LKTTQEQVEKFSAQLESNSPLLIDKQIEVERVLEKLRDDHENLGRLKDMLMQEDQLFVVQREQAENIRQECESKLKSATPELYAAIASL
jgi:dynein heavy chain, axonemal